MKAPGLHDPFRARLDDPDERLAITHAVRRERCAGDRHLGGPSQDLHNLWIP